MSVFFFFFSSRRRHTRLQGDWSSDVCSSDLDPQIGLEDTIAFHQALLASGAPINEVNILRKHFSAVKGGRLAIAAPGATKVSLLLPDVPLRTLDALSSGPTSPDHSTNADARDVLKKYDLAGKLPSSVSAFFERMALPES